MPGKESLKTLPIFENYILFLQCVGPFGVGRKKRSPLFLNSNQVSRDQKLLSCCFDQDVNATTAWSRLSLMFDSLPLIGRVLEAISSDAPLDRLVEFFFLFMIKIYVSMLSYRVNFFSASPSLMDTIQSKLHAIWFPNTPFPMSVSSLLLPKAEIDLDNINAKPAWNMWRQPILCT